MTDLRPATDARRLAVRILGRVFGSDSYADILLDSAYKKTPIPQKDRALCTEIVYGTLRWWKKLNWILERQYRGDWNRVPDPVRRSCEAALYQVLFLEKVPSYAAVDAAVRIAAETENGKWKGTVNAVLRTVLRTPDSLKVPYDPQNPAHAISVEWSHPQWLVQRWIDRFGLDRTVSICRADNDRPRVGIRVNRLRTDRAAVKRELADQGIQAEENPYLDDFLEIQKIGNLISTQGFSDGLYSVQDISAGLVGKLVDPKPGESILDLAAAPGGKTTYLAELSGDRADITAVDIRKSRLSMVEENRERLGLNSIRTVAMDGRGPIDQRFDKVLVDAPCSGLGTIRRRPELKWRKKPEDIANLVSIQNELLDSGSAALKPEGVLVYSTCTVLEEENRGIVHRFLNAHPEFTVEPAEAFVHPDLVSDSRFIETWPDVHGTDGSFAVRLKRMEDNAHESI
jgi:16S rRNA (cytosine967-C5)-methyltransferase